jgi:hypothetical protein
MEETTFLALAEKYGFKTSVFHIKIKIDPLMLEPYFSKKLY